MSLFLRTVPLLLSALLLVRAHAVRANELDRLFQDSVVFTNVGYTGGSNVISNFPLRVDISSARPNGFLYDLAGGKASELRFNYHAGYIDHGTNAIWDATVNFAVTNWNTEGVSTLYVQLPFFSNSQQAWLTMYWNPVASAEIPLNNPLAVVPAVVDSTRPDLWNQAIRDQEANANYIACAPAYRRCSTGPKYLNYWLEEPRLTLSKWKQGAQAATVFYGTPASPSPVSSVEYIDRSDNTSYGAVMPVTPGVYRAVVTVAECATYASLSKDLEFEIESGASPSGIATTNDFANLVTYSLNSSYIPTYKDKPFLVRLSPNDPSGFSYDSFKFGATEDAFYSDVRFYDEKDNPLNYEIHSWNTSGESFVWVQVTNLTENTRITMCWNQGSGSELPVNDAASVWSGEDPSSWFTTFKSGYSSKVKRSAVSEDTEKQLQNRWKIEPAFSVTQWRPGETPAVVTEGVSYSGAAVTRYYDRSTGDELSEMPTETIGEYRAVFRCEETAGWSALEKAIEFRIIKELDSHELGETNERVLLANNDWSVDGAAVYGQSYDDNEGGWGLPYWTHHERGSKTDVSDFDCTKLFSGYNLFAGTYHEYVEDGAENGRIWGLENVRFGNLFNNGRTHPGEQGDVGLQSRQNYLPWNPQSERMLGYEGLAVGQYHRFAGTFLLQNVCDDRRRLYAQVCSPCYTNGIGTVYFDIVNAFTDNVRDADGNASYAIVVEVATNVWEYSGLQKVSRPFAPTDDRIQMKDGESEDVVDYYFYADWKPVTVHPIRFRDDTGDAATDCEALPATTTLELDITDGGTAKNFYRVYAPVNVNGAARFRLRRVRIDEGSSLNPDADAFIIVDNLICSPAREMTELRPYGLDRDRHGKQYLGQEAAFLPAFPGPRDAVVARVKALDSHGAETAPGMVTAATMHYRWHYLDQRKSPWQSVDFDPTTFVAHAPLVLPGLPGDIEFWFEGTQNYGYYTYANYSGTKIGIRDYSEAFSVVTNGWDGTRAAWNLRIREGSSDYESAVMIVREPEADKDLEIEMELVDSHQWRGYYQTLERIPEGVKVRFELRNKQTDVTASLQWNTNCLYCAERNADLASLPFSGKLTSATTNEWTHLVVDATTGYLMVQIEDSTLGVSFVRADYQNFNHWTDGHGDVFVGVAADDKDLPSSGVSPKTRDFAVSYTERTSEISLPTNELWTLDFEGRTYDSYYKTFPAGEQVVNSWKLGKGQYVYSHYFMPSSGTALQMAGGSEGFAEMSDQTLGVWPRGIEKVVFNARLAQNIEFDDFSYFDEGRRLNNYVFTANVAFDHDSNCSFTGNASLSLIAYYRRGAGCYEARWEQVIGSTSKDGKVVIGPDSKGQRLSIYRWNSNGHNGYDQTLLCCLTNSVSLGGFAMPEANAALPLTEAKMLPMSIAAYATAEGNTMIVVGFNPYDKGSTAGKFDPTKGWRYVAYCDGSANRLSAGSYGVVSANSPGLFVCPQFAAFGSTTPTWGSLNLPTKAGQCKWTSTDSSFPTFAWESCYVDICDGAWVVIPGRCEILNNPKPNFYGFRAADVWQTVDLIASKASGTESFTEKIGSFSISNNWGHIMSGGELDKVGVDLPLVWHTPDVKIRLRTGGDLDDRSSPGVVIDNVQVYQWRGKNEILLYEGGDSPDRPNDKVTSADPDNFVYTSGWIKDAGSGQTVMELSARRTLDGRPAGVRTPLMDGKTKQSGSGTRGSGIGNIAFTYRNVQTNVVLLVQVATEVSASDLPNLTKDVSTGSTFWRTVKRFDYAALGDAGTKSVAFGIRNRTVGSGCLARVIIDPELVKSVASVVDPTAFGSLDIVNVTCQDEPPIDTRCWWGWNMRTLGDADDPERRMYLPDASMEPSVGYSLALNNSIRDAIDETKKDDYKKHMPFLQTPSFTNNVIGQVTFRARKYGSSDREQAAEVALYGITRQAIESGGDWELVTRFAVSNTLFTGYTYRLDSGVTYSALRLGVTGVSGVDPAERGPKPEYGSEPVRVLIDEVVVSEAISPELAFRNVGAFRSDMSGTHKVEGVPGRTEQPLCGEGWGVQCELFTVMLGEEIDLTKPPRVKLYWYPGNDVWGFNRWKERPGVRSAWLARAEGTSDLIYRSSYETAPDSVIPQSVKEPGGYPKIVQYMLEVYYTTRDPKTGKRQEEQKVINIAAGEWEVPEWYSPVDYNADPYRGGGTNTACYCILDDLAPGWAWINEVNIYSDEDRDYVNEDDNCQFVEIAAPRTADLTGWRLEMLQPLERYGMIVTNTVAVFGTRGLRGTKDVNVCSNYVFHVIAEKDQFNGHDRSILYRDGALDGIWNFEDPSSLFQSSGIIGWADSFGIRLVRPNGIVEHEIVAVGTNRYYAAYNAIYTPTGVVAYLNREMKPGRFFHPCPDDVSGDHSVGVFEGQGADKSVWNKTMRRTPGEINEGQQINPDHPVPFGDMMVVYFDLDQSGGNIRQSLTGVEGLTNASLRAFIRNGSMIGTNVLYQVDSWYEVASAKQTTPTDVKYLDVSNGFVRATRTVEVCVGKGCSNQVTVVAKAKPDQQLQDLGCDEKNVYTPAVIKWLQGGKTMKGPFYNNDGTIRPAEFWGLHCGKLGDLSLTEMYWLDIDPTAGDMVFQAGMCKPPTETLAPVYSGYDAPAFVTNLQMSVFMMITNKTTDTASPYYAQPWSPYVLRGIAPDDCSTNYTAGSGNVWTSATFKISGLLPNGHTSESNRDNWVDLRWFIFQPDSFYQPSDEPTHQRFTTDIEIRDPMNCKDSPGYGAGWYDWARDPEHPERAKIRPFFRWHLDTRLKPFAVETLRKNNTYTNP